jgi:hypothetical protein
MSPLLAGVLPQAPVQPSTALSEFESMAALRETSDRHQACARVGSLTQLVAWRNRAYLRSEYPGCAMPTNALSSPSSLPARSRLVLWVGLAAAGLLVGATIVLWVHYGTAVFFETIVAGIAACF